MTHFETEIPKTKYVRKIERILYEYPSLKAAIENEQELEHEGLGNLFPSMISSYSDSPRGGDISKPTERFAIKRADKSLKVRQIERGLEAITNKERELIMVKYFSEYVPSDDSVMCDMGISNRKYYKLKDQALRKMAIALNVI